jgi:hypothetical protein
MPGAPLTVEDIIAEPIFSKALTAFAADGTWVEKTWGSIKQLYNDPPEVRGQAICMVARFVGVTEELHRRT